MEVNKGTLPKGWTIAMFEEILDIQGGSQPPKSKFLYEPKVGYIQLLQIRDFGKKPVPTFVPIKLATKFCKKDDVLIARYGASLGRIVTGLEGAYKVALAKVIDEHEVYNRRLLFYLLQTSLLQTPLKMLSRSAQNGFAKHEIAKIEFPIIPLNEQKRILAKLEQLLTDLEKGIEYLKTSKQQLKVYRQAVLKWAFEGKLTKFWRSQQGIIKSQKDLIQMIDIARKNFQSSQIAEWEESIRNWESNGSLGKKPPRPSKIVNPDLPNSDHVIRKLVQYAL
jgi:type I restriction enzyme, S subunit